MVEVFKYVNLNNVKTFDPDISESSYVLTSSILTKLCTIVGLKYLYDFEKNNDIIIALRGITKNKNFRDYDLNKFFVVGEKSKYYLQENKRDLYCGDFDNKEELIININKIIDEINEIIKEREEKKHPINGELNYINDELDIDELRIEKLVYLSVLHNIGNRWREKNSSPFMSVTYGKNKLETALEFCKTKNAGEIGFVCIYFIPKNTKYFIKTERIAEILKDKGIKWYEDIHREMMMVDGIFPHYLFGVLEIINDETHELILNPWLYKQISNKYPFSPLEGILVNQSKFSTYAKELGYRKYYFEIDCNRQQFSIDNNPLDECIEFDN